MKIKLIKKNPKAIIPQHQTQFSAGLDLHACLDEIVVLQSGERKLIKCGIAISIPKGYEGQVRPRSGNALKYGVTVLNSPGTIDSDYTGEIGVILINTDLSPFYVEHGDRIAQLVIAKHETVEFEEVKTLEETNRGDGGFGSTNKK